MIQKFEKTTKRDNSLPWARDPKMGTRLFGQQPPGLGNRAGAEKSLLSLKFETPLYPIWKKRPNGWLCNRVWNFVSKPRLSVTFSLG